MALDFTGQATAASKGTQMAFKILNIRRRTYRSGRAHLLRLPRELRDAIYGLVLVETPLLQREHRPGCPGINILAGAETPVCKSKLAEARYLFSKDTVLSKPKEILLTKNTFCFPFICAFSEFVQDADEAALGLMRRVMLFEGACDKSPSGVSLVRYWSANPWWADLSCLVNLQELCLPVEVLVWCYDAHVLRLKQLKLFRAHYLKLVGGWPETFLWRPTPGDDTIHLLLEREIALPRCAACLSGEDEDYCWRCDGDIFRSYRRLRAEFYPDFSYWWPSGDDSQAIQCLRKARDLVFRSGITSRRGEPLKVSLELDDNIRKEATLLGLPRFNEGTREKIVSGAAKKESIARVSNARKVCSKPSLAPLTEAAEDGDLEPVLRRSVSERSGPSSARPKAVDTPAESSKESLKEQRTARLRHLAQAEKYEEKAARKSTGAALQASMAATAASKQAARKRAGRR